MANRRPPRVYGAAVNYGSILGNDKHFEIVVYTNGLVIKYYDGATNVKNYKKVLKFPEHMIGQVKQLLEDNRKNHPGVFNTQYYTTVAIEHGIH